MCMAAGMVVCVCVCVEGSMYMEAWMWGGAARMCVRRGKYVYDISSCRQQVVTGVPLAQQAHYVQPNH